MNDKKNKAEFASLERSVALHMQKRRMDVSQNLIFPILPNHPSITTCDSQGKPK